MTESTTKRDLSGEAVIAEGDRKRYKPSAEFFLPWAVSFSLIALFGVTAYFYIQIISLREELAAFKSNLSVFEKERPRNVRKRSSDELDKEAVSGIQAAHLQGTFPFQHIEKQGKIGPWSLSSTDNSFIRLRAKNTEIEIIQSGLYYIYAQVYYLTSQPHNSFQILSYNGTEERKHHRNLVKCSSQGRNSIGEASCYTGFTGSFHSGQRLYLNQIEQNRIIHFTNGCSYLGVILLNKNAIFNRKK